MPMSLTLRNATSADLTGLRRLQHASMRQLAIAYYDDDVIEAFIDHVGTMDDRLVADGTYFVATVGEAVVGCGGWSSRMPTHDAHAAAEAIVPLPGGGNVRSIFVHPAFARQGIARRIMAHIEAEVAASGQATASLTATLSGVPFYRRIGYRSGAPIVLRLPGDLLFVGIEMSKPLAARAIMAAA